MPERATYGWIITRDWLSEKYPNEGEATDKGVIGPRNISPDVQKRLEAGEGKKFKMYDDDGELYYDGRILRTEDADYDEDFEPLTDFGMPNAGCTEIRYKNKEGKYETL